MIDLHSHTCYSDGKFTPAQVIEEAARIGVRVLAITDHDNARGSREAAPLARQVGIELIPGIEITTRWDEVDLPEEDRSVDLLGYGLDIHSQAFHAFEALGLQNTADRIADCCAWLSSFGCTVTLEDVRAENPCYPGLLQLIYALLHKQCYTTWKAARDISVRAWAQSRPPRISIQEAIAFIHKQGGAAVLAHPMVVRPSGQRLEAGDLAMLVEAGLDGLEVYHYSAKPQDREHLLSLARKADLITTGGSDLHGWIDGFADFGKQPVTVEILGKLQERIGRYR